MRLCMATKTISVDLEAYERLRSARVRPGESFSQVIKRASWSRSPSTGATLLAALEDAEPLPEEVLKRLDAAQEADSPPRDQWKD